MYDSFIQRDVDGVMGVSCGVLLTAGVLTTGGMPRKELPPRV